MLDTDPSPLLLEYASGERGVVTALVVAGAISMLSIFVLFGLSFFVANKYKNTHFQAYFVCLLLGNAMQAWGTIMSLKWVQMDRVVDGPFCYAQGGIKQGGNLATAIWSLVISFHLFLLLFVRYQTTKIVSWGIIALGWSLTFGCVFLGPVAIQKAARGHYFGISGLWCWITPAYHTEQVFLEYFFQFLAVSLNIILHVATLMRVRGNLIRKEGRWRVRWVGSRNSWQLALGRDFTDSSMLRLAQHMVWYPIAYAVTIIPISVVRFSAFCGVHVPLPVYAVAGVVFDLGGFVNVALFLGARHFFPDQDSVPEFNAQRPAESEKIVEAYGVTPFTLQRPMPVIPKRESSRRISAASITSLTPLTRS